MFNSTPSSLCRTVANVVLPSPGGPSKRMCGSGSPRFFEADRAMARRSATLRWPITSSRRWGRSFSSTDSGARASSLRCGFSVGSPADAPLMIGSLIAIHPRGILIRPTGPWLVSSPTSDRVAILLVDRVDHVGDALVLLLAGEDPVDRLSRLALVVADREERLVGVADDVGLDVVGHAVGLGLRPLRGVGRADDERELADLAAELGHDPLGGRLADP